MGGAPAPKRLATANASEPRMMRADMVFSPEFQQCAYIHQLMIYAEIAPERRSCQIFID
jgi:hypothetical protein